MSVELIKGEMCEEYIYLFIFTNIVYQTGEWTTLAELSYCVICSECLMLII